MIMLMIFSITNLCLLWLRISLHLKQTMGVRYLTSKLRETGITPDKLAQCELLNGKIIGIDLLVILHKALGTNDGVG